MWRTGRTQFKSRFHDCADSELLPTPLQRPVLPTYVTIAGSDNSVKWCAERLLPVIFGSGLAPEAVRQKMELYADTATEFEHSSEAITETLDKTWQLKQLHVGSTTDRAINEFRDGITWYMEALNNRTAHGFSGSNQPYDYYVAHQAVIIGSSQKVIDSIGEFHERSGVNNLLCWMSIGDQPNAQVLNAIAKFGEEVIPALRDVLTVPGKQS
jgi:alkanesulfonate monooxygenase SsuD/methylene tetrahydromethanopterin reductase-like flavin-dependent oxidoreductase (luciferase family)